MFRYRPWPEKSHAVNSSPQLANFSHVNPTFTRIYFSIFVIFGQNSLVWPLNWPLFLENAFFSFVSLVEWLSPNWGIFSGGKIEFKSHVCFTMSHSPLPNNFSNIIIPKSHASENETVRNKFFPVGTMSLLSVFVLSVFKWFKIVVFPELSNPTTTILATAFFPNPRALIRFSKIP